MRQPGSDWFLALVRGPFPMEPAQAVITARDRGRVDEDPFTTVMIRRLPVDMTPAKLVAMINMIVPGKFDFIYTPYDRRKKVNISLSFINLMDSISAKELCDHINNLNACRQWTLVACDSSVQSLSFNMAYYVARFGRSAIHDPHAPWVFKDGKRVTRSALSRVYGAIPAWVYEEAQNFVRAEKAGNSSKGIHRRAKDLVWKPIFWSSSGEKGVDVGQCDSAWETHLPDTRDHIVRCHPDLLLQEGLAEQLLEKHGQLLISC